MHQYSRTMLWPVEKTSISGLGKDSTGLHSQYYVVFYGDLSCHWISIENIAAFGANRD